VKEKKKERKKEKRQLTMACGRSMCHVVLWRDMAQHAMHATATLLPAQPGK